MNHKKKIQQIGKYVQSCRRRLNLSLEDTALRCGIAKSTLFGFETGTSGIKLVTLLKIDEFFKGYGIKIVEFKIKEYSRG